MTNGGVGDQQRVVVTDGTGAVWTEARPVRRPDQGEALVRVRAVGICGSDLGLIQGEGPPWTDYPVVLGHEVCAEVVELGPGVDSVSVGDRVALHGFIFCGRCTACLGGRYYQCDDLEEIGFTVDGGYREYAVWPAHTLNPIPDEIDDAAATQIDSAGCMLHALKRVDLSVTDTAAVLGAGSMGLYAVQLLQALGVSDVAVTGIIEERLRAAEALGASRTIDVREEDPVDALLDYTDDAGVNVCIEAAGAGDVVNTAVASAAKQGQIVLIGIFDSLKEFDPNDVVVNELTIIGGVTSAHAGDEVIELFRRGDLTVDGIVTHEFDLSDYETALELAGERRDGLIKAVLRP